MRTMPITRATRPVAAVAVASLLAAACTSGDGTGSADATSGADAASGRMVAQVASYQHLVGDANRVLVGLIAPDGQRLVTFGTVTLRFAYLGTADAPVDPEPGPEATAAYLPIPGSREDPGAERPRASQPSEARGVYEAVDVAFDRAGFWQVEVEADVEDLGVRRAAAALEVLEEPRTPAPGQPAIPSENLTLADRGEVPAAAIDSRAELMDGAIPDRALHRITIADAIASGRPTLVLFSTPVYCVSRFCGPMTDALASLERRYGDAAAFVMVEIWRDFQAQEVNEAAADWLLRDGELHEPVLFLIDGSGTIERRWDNVFAEDDVADALGSLLA
jgi:hypothetical protein